MQLKNVIGKNQKQYFKIVGWGFRIKIQFLQHILDFMLSIARNRERVLTFVIDYQRSQPKSVSEGERLSEAEWRRRSNGARGSDGDGVRGRNGDGVRGSNGDGVRGNESERERE